MADNLFEVLNKVNHLPGEKLHAYFANNIQNVNAGRKGWGNLKIAITTEDAQQIMAGIMGKNMSVSIMLFIVDRDSMEQVKTE